MTQHARRPGAGSPRQEARPRQDAFNQAPLAPILTRHSEVRLQQRGIPRWYVEALVSHGRHCHAPGGAEIVCVDKSARQRLGRNLSREAFARAERYFNVYAVVAPGGVLVTVARWQRGAHRPD